MSVFVESIFSRCHISQYGQVVRSSLISILNWRSIKMVHRVTALSSCRCPVGSSGWIVRFRWTLLHIRSLPFICRIEEWVRFGKYEVISLSLRPALTRSTRRFFSSSDHGVCWWRISTPLLWRCLRTVGSATPHSAAISAIVNPSSRYSRMILSTISGFVVTAPSPLHRIPVNSRR